MLVSTASFLPIIIVGPISDLSARPRDLRDGDRRTIVVVIAALTRGPPRCPTHDRRPIRTATRPPPPPAAGPIPPVAAPLAAEPGQDPGMLAGPADPTDRD
jgi:hypothetical protein